MAKEDQIPLHHFTQDDGDSVPFQLHTLEKRTYYDFTVPHRHNYFEIFLFEEGGGKHLIDFDEFDVNSQSMHFVSPGQVHLLKRAPGSFGYIVVFSRDFFYHSTSESQLLFKHPLLHNRTHYPIIKTDETLFGNLLNCVKRMEHEMQQQGHYRDELIRLYLQELLFKSAEGLIAKQPQPDLVMQFFALLETQFFSLHLVRQYAQELNCTDKFLGETLKTHTGKGTQEHINQRLMLEAKRLLQYSDLNAREIGYRLGFEDPAHFGKFFKKHAGCSPGSFRQEQ